MRVTILSILTGCVVALSVGTAFAGNSCRDGVAKAVVCTDLKIDGNLSDWDWSEAVMVWNAEERADRENVTVLFGYDETYFYVGAAMSLDGRAPKNVNRPQDRYWYGDLIQVRMCVDKSLGWPLPGRARLNPIYKENDQVTCINLWRDTMAGADYCYITPGAAFDCPPITNPEGGEFKAVSSFGKLVMEAKIPWSSLSCKNGKCPFSPGEKMPAVVDVKWEPGTDGHSAAAVFGKDPGTFAFLNLDTWGRIEFLPRKTGTAGNKKSAADSEAFYKKIAETARGKGPDTADWAKIAFDLPKRAKVSVNVFDGKGAVVRELMGGEWQDAGRVEVRWDGRDALGHPCETGRDYRWGVYAHDGIDVVYAGTVGVSGEPPYDTPDGKGGWGADHGPPVACAADDTGRYFVWHRSEQGCALVKTDFEGKVVWRTNPFVRGGWGEYTAAGVSDGILWLIHGGALKDKKSAIVKVDAMTGRHILFEDGSAFVELPCFAAATNLPPRSCVRYMPDSDCAGVVNGAYGFNCSAVAAKGDVVYVGDHNGNRVLKVAAASGKVTGEIHLEKPRGLTFAADGTLWAVSGKKIVRIKNGKPECAEITEELSNPYAIALGEDGTVYVSDLGDSQQVKAFAPADGKYKLRRAYGKAGGRGFLGKIDYDAFLYPFGLATDKTGALLVGEASAPKIVTILDAATGSVRRRYVGYSAYSPSNVPDCDDPLVQYYSIEGPGAFARQKVSSGESLPDASWDFRGAGIEEFGSIFSTMNIPEVMRCTNGKKYLVPDSTSSNRTPGVPMTLCLINGDEVKPVAAIMQKKSATRGRPNLVIWTDSDGDGRRDESECAEYSEIAGKSWRWACVTGAMRMEANGDLFLVTYENTVIGIPAKGFNKCGAPIWDVKSAYVAIPTVIPELKSLYHSWRSGVLGFRRDSKGCFYATVNCNLPYVTPELTKVMKLGMGHSSEYNGVFICKYAPDGSLLWRTGRKAIGSLKPGEMLHHWSIAGILGDDYAVAASEWGNFTVYTADGFFVDTLFDIPSMPGRGGPYVFGGEDFSGRMQAYPERGEVWAYNSGRTFKVTGFENCRVKGEWRTEGVVRLERVAPLFVPGKPAKPLENVRLTREGGKVVFTARVVDETPLVNSATGAEAVFKGGDSVGFEIGPGNKLAGTAGFTRILAARLGGKDRVIAMKPFTNGVKKPQEYSTPAGGTAAFEFIGDAPGASVTFVTDAGGYTVRIEVPERFLELDFSKPVFWDAQVLLSGDGARGVGTVKRVYLYNVETSHTSMVDDTPTEARLHPEGYAEIDLKNLK